MRRASTGRARHAVLDAAQRPRLVGGLEVVAEAFAAATPEPRADILMEYARRLGWSAALRRLGSLADALHWSRSRVG